MKKLVSLLLIVLLAGCISSDSSAIADRNKLREYAAIYKEKSKAYEKELEAIQYQMTELFSGFTKEQLGATKKWLEATDANNTAQFAIADRELADVLPKDQIDAFKTLYKREMYLREEADACGKVIAILYGQIQKSEEIQRRSNRANAAAMQGLSQGLNNSYMMDQQLKGDTQIIYPLNNNNNNNSTHWQEKNARRKYFDAVSPLNR